MSTPSIHAMTVTFEPKGYGPTFRATCSDSAADCHYICAEECETWGEIVRNEDGAVMGHVVDDTDEPLHLMKHYGECNYVTFLDNDYEVAESMEGGPVTFTIPAEFIFDGCDEVTWKATT